MKGHNCTKKHTLFDGIEGVIWDLDNTLYRLDEAVIHAFNLAVARAVLAEGIDLPLDKATEMATESFHEKGYSGAVFVESYGINPTRLHFNFQNYLDESVIRKSQKIHDLFAQTHLRHALITHSPRKWAQRVLLHLDLLEWFPKDNIMALEDYNFEKKSESALGFNMTLEKLELSAAKTVVIEDTIENLRIPYEMGINTVYIHQGKEPETLPDYVHFHCRNAIDALEHILCAQKKKNGEI